MPVTQSTSKPERATLCRACGKRFGGTSGFDAHRAGKFTNEHPSYGRYCLDDDALLAKGLVLVDGVWRNKAPDRSLFKTRERK